MLGDSVCRLLYQPPMALFTDINRLMTKYSSLSSQLRKYLDTPLPFVDVCDRERNRHDKGRAVVSYPSVSQPPTLTHNTARYS